jgi:ferritin
LRSFRDTLYLPSERRFASPASARRLHTIGQRLQRGLDLQQRFFGFTTLFYDPSPRPLRGGAMPATRFVERLNEQVSYEFAASQQYVANAVFYDAEALPRLAAFFYVQALEERDHALMMVRYLLDADAPVVVPGVDAPQVEFADIVEPVALALAQEKRVADQINAIAAAARGESDFTSEQFVQWFIKEQVEEIATMSDLLRVVERSRDDPMEIENYMAREHPGTASDDPTAPSPAGAGT